MIGNLSPAYLAMIILLFQQNLTIQLDLVPTPASEVVKNETRTGLLDVPCISNVFCWLYCQFFIDGLTGTGCCWDRQRKDDKNNLFHIPEAQNVCWCCRGVSALSTTPDAVDKYCKILNPNNTNMDAATALLTSTAEVLPCVDKVQCSKVQVNVSMLLPVGKPC